MITSIQFAWSQNIKASMTTVCLVKKVTKSLATLQVVLVFI